MTALVLPDAVCTDGASGTTASCRIPLYSSVDLCDHSSSGVVSWTFPVLHSQAGYYALVGTVYADATPFDTPAFLLSVDGNDADSSSVFGGPSGAFFWSPRIESALGPFPGTVCAWPYPSWFLADTGMSPTDIFDHNGFWLGPGYHTIAIRFSGWTWDGAHDDVALCSTLWAAHFAQLTLLAGVPCPGYVYGSPDTIALRLTINPLAPTGLRLTVPTGKALRLTING